ncbi:hypothetical protein U9M48_041298 [Paspalum notatum var. saurae]|uniref:Uncharacterized protein n=1 Tax=Paspalum notatum var. saurae TaxID=547442 RepID=A0AAQ3UNP8_PASNO
MVASAYKGVIESVLAKLKDLTTGDMCASFIGVSSGDVLFLRDELPAMNALLHKLDDADELDPEARNWRNQVREMAYDIEDCIDDFTSNVADDGGASNSKAAAGFLDRASHFLRTCRAHLEAAWQIKELRTRLQEINERRKRYKVDRCYSMSSARATATSVVVDPRISAFYKEAASLVGIDGPKRELTKLVMDEEEERLKVMSIVGFGGLGKTTLASQVYRQVGGQFSCKAFVSVSQKPDMARLLTSVLFQLKQHPSDASGVQDLINSLREYLHDKRHASSILVLTQKTVISKVEVLKRWVAEGFVSHSPGQDAWAVAESYFNELVNRSMIQLPYQQGHCTEVSHCRVHDMMLDMILMRCKEDNFISVIRDPQVATKVQDKIRRLTIDLNGVVDDTMAMNITRKVSHVRSLAVFGGTRWIPPLLEFKFLRVLFLEFFLREMTIDLTGINQLSQLRYLKVECKECLLDGDIPSQVSIVLPSQIRRLQHLETLELPWVSDCSIPSLSYIIDLPRLTHLMLRQHKGGMPDGIGKVKSLRTLHGFNLPVSSIENIDGLGELTNLSDLSVHCGKGHPNSTMALGWMAALSCSLEKLGNLKVLSVRSNSVGYCADSMSSWFSPPFPNLEKLDLLDWTFSKVPRWVGRLHCLRELALGAKQILQEDVSMVGTRLPFLVYLSMRVIPGMSSVKGGSSIVIEGSTGFMALRLFCFDSSTMSSLEFRAGAMPQLRRLLLGLDPLEWDEATPVGLEQLPCLEEIRVLTASSAAVAGCELVEERSALVNNVFHAAANALPSHQTFFLLPRIRSLSDHPSRYQKH